MDLAAGIARLRTDRNKKLFRARLKASILIKKVILAAGANRGRTHSMYRRQACSPCRNHCGFCNGIRAKHDRPLLTSVKRPKRFRATKDHATWRRAHYCITKTEESEERTMTRQGFVFAAGAAAFSILVGAGLQTTTSSPASCQDQPKRT